MEPWVYTLLFCSAIIIFFLRGKIKSNGKKLPPGPIRWPIIGSIPQMLKINKDYPYIQINGLRKVYGDIISLGFGMHYAVAISSFELMKDLLKREETLDRFRFQFVEQRNLGKNLGLVWGDGSAWKEIRKFTFSTLREFGFGKSRQMEQIIQDEVDCFIDDVREEAKESQGIWAVNPNKLSVITVNSLWSSVAGYRFDPKSIEIQRHMELNAESVQVMGPTNLLSAFPFLKVFPEWSGFNSNGKILEKSHRFISELVESVKLKRDSKTKAENLVETFLDEIEKNRGVVGTEMTEEQLILTLMDLFLAATETTSSMQHWLILELALNRGIQEKARSQILALARPGAKLLSLADRDKLPYIVAILLETIRHCPFAPLPPPRRAIRDIMFEGYFIPKGTCLLFNLNAVYNEHSVWGDETVFRPERFLDSSGTKLNQEKVERMVHFGFGKRVCPGDSLANDTLFLFITSLLLNFRLDVVSGREAILKAGKPGITIRPLPYVLSVTDLQ